MSQFNTKTPPDEYKKLHWLYGNIDFDSLDVDYLKNKRIEHSSFIPLCDQIRHLSKLCPENNTFFNGPAERSIALVANMVKTWLAHPNMPHKM